MSMGATPDTAIPHDQAWPHEVRLQTMRKAIATIDMHGDLTRLVSSAIAASYRLLEAEIDAEKMKHLREGEGK